MKLNEIMVIRKEGEESRLKILLVDDNTLSRLTQIRGCFYKDDPRLKLVKDMPTPKPEVTMAPEMRRLAEDSFRLHQMQAGKLLPIVKQTEPQTPMSFEEQIQYDWKSNSGIRKEFLTFGSYQAFKRAKQAGKVKLFGCKS